MQLFNANELIYDFLFVVSAAHLPNRVYLSADHQYLSIENICKKCIGDPDRTTDRMSIKCTAGNRHSTTSAEAVLDVLGKRVISLSLLCAYTTSNRP